MDLGGRGGGANIFGVRDPVDFRLCVGLLDDFEGETGNTADRTLVFLLLFFKRLSFLDINFIYVLPLLGGGGFFSVSFCCFRRFFFLRSTLLCDVLLLMLNDDIYYIIYARCIYIYIEIEKKKKRDLV